jgi:hypothetical protein
MSTQNAQLLICETRTLTSSFSRGSSEMRSSTRIMAA